MRPLRILAVATLLLLVAIAEGNAQTFLKNLFGGKKYEATLVVTSSGANKDEAVKSGLRNALEQAYGAFISSNTTLVNDEIVRDEIVDLSRGNIRSYKELSASIDETRGSAIVSLEVVVSLNRLTEFVQAKGGSIEFAGANFDANMKMIELNKSNERKVLDDLAQQLCGLQIVDCTLALNSPIAEEADYRGEFRNYLIEGMVICTANANTKQYNELVMSTVKALSMNKKEREQYDKLNLRYSTIRTYNLPYNTKLLEEKDPIKKLMHASDECQTFYLRNMYGNDPIFSDYSQLTNNVGRMPSLTELNHGGLLYSILSRICIKSDVEGLKPGICWASNMYNGKWSYASRGASPEIFCVDPALLGSRWDWVPSINANSFNKKKFNLAISLDKAYGKCCGEGKPTTSIRSIRKGEMCALMPFVLVIPKEEIGQYTGFSVTWR